MKTRLHLPVTFKCESTLGYRPDFDSDPIVMDRAFEGAGLDFLAQVIQRMAEADDCLSLSRYPRDV